MEAGPELVAGRLRGHSLCWRAQVRVLVILLQNAERKEERRDRKRR